MASTEPASDLLDGAREAYENFTLTQKVDFASKYDDVFDFLRDTDEIFVKGQHVSDYVGLGTGGSSYSKMMGYLEDMGLIEMFASGSSKATYLAGYQNEEHDWERYEDSHWDERENVVETLLSEDDAKDFGI